MKVIESEKVHLFQHIDKMGGTLNCTFKVRIDKSENTRIDINGDPVEFVFLEDYHNIAILRKRFQDSTKKAYEEDLFTFRGLRATQNFNI